MSPTGTVSPKQQNCTYTIGFWKNHEASVANFLPKWLGIANTGKSAEVKNYSQAFIYLSNSGDASNGINKLYAQLLGAKLNAGQGASISGLNIDSIDAFLVGYDSRDWIDLSDVEKQKVLDWQKKLDDYNNGITGPGHCN